MLTNEALVAFSDLPKRHKHRLFALPAGYFHHIDRQIGQYLAAADAMRLKRCAHSAGSLPNGIEIGAVGASEGTGVHSLGINGDLRQQLVEAFSGREDPKADDAGISVDLPFLGTQVIGDYDLDYDLRSILILEHNVGPCTRGDRILPPNVH